MAQQRVSGSLASSFRISRGTPKSSRNLKELGSTLEDEPGLVPSLPQMTISLLGWALWNYSYHSPFVP